MSRRRTPGKGLSPASLDPDAFLDDFAVILAGALRLETVKDGTYRSVQLWTPATQRNVYGGQLVAHTVEAVYRTVSKKDMRIHSLHISFIAPGLSTPAGDPIEYNVTSLREGRSFLLRQVRATQGTRVILLAVAGFHRQETPGIQHELALPHFLAEKPGSTPREAFGQRLEELLSTSGDDGAVVARRASPSAAKCGERGEESVLVEYLNLTLDAAKAGTPMSKKPHDVWARLGEDQLNWLASVTAIPRDRLDLVVCCWLSDFIVALAVLVPHGLPNPNLRMIASLDHAIYFHNPQSVDAKDWFLYEVRSSWAGNNRGLNHGRMYGRDGQLWMSVAQETVLRMKRGYVSKL